MYRKVYGVTRNSDTVGLTEASVCIVSEALSQWASVGSQSIAINRAVGGLSLPLLQCEYTAVKEVSSSGKVVGKSLRIAAKGNDSRMNRIRLLNISFL
jgi:hypothetical protein